MAARIQLSIDSHVADVMLDRADKHNAIDLAMFDALADTADRIAAEPAVRAVVLHGAGQNFCAGIDLSVLTASDLDFADALQQPLTPSVANRFQRAAYAWRELAVPVICAIEGVAFGGGCQIALGADVRLAAADARFSIMESKWGIIPDMAITATLRNLVAPDKVKELAWTARIIDAAEAAELGLITKVVDDPLQASHDLARECAARSPQAIRGIKSLVNRAWQLSEAEALALEASLQRGIIGGTNQIEAVRANVEKRQPQFRD